MVLHTCSTMINRASRFCFARCSSMCCMNTSKCAFRSRNGMTNGTICLGPESDEGCPSDFASVLTGDFRSNTGRDGVAFGRGRSPGTTTPHAPPGEKAGMIAFKRESMNFGVSIGTNEVHTHTCHCQSIAHFKLKRKSYKTHGVAPKFARSAWQEEKLDDPNEH